MDSQDISTLGTLSCVQIRRAVLNAIVAHARKDSPRECCGLLLGDANEIVEAVAVTNVAGDPLRRYELSAAEHLAQIKSCRERSTSVVTVEVIGAYHSHPRTRPEPSPTDLEQACHEFLYVIAGPVAEAAPIEVRGFWLDEVVFKEVALVVVD